MSSSEPRLPQHEKRKVFQSDAEDNDDCDDDDNRGGSKQHHLGGGAPVG